mgnify:CR=1 FL=1
MKTKTSISILFILLMIIPGASLKAQDPITVIIKEAIVKVIKAADLQIQRLQNETIWLQNAQKKVENTMSQLKLEEIKDWVAQQKELYAAYFDELQRVKTALAYYHQVKDIIELQKAMLRDYKTAYEATKKDHHFTPDEIIYIGGIYNAMLKESIENLDLLSMIIESFSLKMSDADRLELLEQVSSDMQAQYNNLKRFANQNRQLSLSRAKDAQDVNQTKALYGL